MAATLANHADRLNLRSGHHGLPPLILVTDRRRLPDPIAAAARLRRGDAVLLRDYDAPDRPELARNLAAFCRQRGLRLIVAGDANLARIVGADGVHWPEGALQTSAARCALARPRLVTAAAHSWPALIAAWRAGADATLVSPIFATASHPGAPWLGPVRFAALAKSSPLPVYALGGINEHTVRRLAGCGAAGVAAIDGFVPAR